MSTTLLNEEQYFLGFLPLQSYLDVKKQVKNATRCPPEKEDLVRSLLFRDALEQLGCTYVDINCELETN